MLEGLTSGFILSIALFPGVIWVARLGMAGSPARTLAAAGGFALAQFLWIAFALPGLLLMLKNLHFMRGAMYVFAAVNLVYLAVKYFRIPRVVSLSGGELSIGAFEVFRGSLVRSLAMPMRLPAAMAVLLATGLFRNNPVAPSTLAPAMLGAAAGVLWWWGKIALLSVFFARKVPEAVTLKSLNKLRSFSGVVFAVLALSALLIGD